MNENFKKAASAVKVLKQKATGLFGALVAFAIDVSVNGDTQVDKGTDIKPLFVEQEKLAAAEMKVHFGKDAPSTYRVVKGLLVACVAAGIQLKDASGKPKGKTALEEELAATKVPKAEIDKFKTAMNTAGAIADKLPAHDRLVAAALVQDLLAKLTVGIELAKAA